MELLVLFVCISPWINKQGVLVLDFVSRVDIGLKNARCVQNGRKGGKAAQILAREGALASGAPPGNSGQPTNKAALDWSHGRHWQGGYARH